MDSTFSLSSSTVLPNGTVILYVSTGKTTGSFNLLISGTSDGIIKTATVVLRVEKERRCIIATAAYGSELSPYVQKLRSFRDEVVMNSFAGREFMKVFNAIYYPWSTPLAKIISRHDTLRTVVRLSIYPLIAVLDLSRAVYELLCPINAELGVIFTGTLAGSLLGLLYLTPIISLALSIRKINKILSFIKGKAHVPLIAGLFMLALGEVLDSSMSVGIGSFLFLLSVVISTAIISGFAVSKRILAHD
jgi:peptide/nickel transport system substrate-binding protein